MGGWNFTVTFPRNVMCCCIDKSWPPGGAVSHTEAASCVWLNHFIHHTQNAKWDTETSAASSSSGYHVGERHIFTLSLINKGLVPAFHANTHSAPCGAETCRTVFSPHWRKDVARDRHGSVGAVHKGKKKCSYIFVYNRVLAHRLNERPSRSFSVFHNVFKCSC